MPPFSRRQTIPLLLLVIILIIGAAVRWHNLEVQSFWYDEGVSAAHALRTLPEMIPLLQRDVHLPGYHWTLALYEDWVGLSEFALRSYSVLWSMISIAFTYALGKRLFGIPAGLAAAVFVALNTFSIYYAQEARMYAMLAGIAAASMWVLVGFLRRLDQDGVGQQRPLYRNTLLVHGVALGLLNALGIYSHVTYGLVMLVQGVMAALWLGGSALEGWQTRRILPTVRTFVGYSAANLLTMALYLPWLATSIKLVGAQPNISPFVPLNDLLNLLQGWLMIGITYAEHPMSGAILYFLLIFGLLLLRTNRTPRLGWRVLLPIIWVLLPGVLYIRLELYERYLRFLIASQLGMALWLGRGVSILWHLQTRQTGILRYSPKFAAIASTALIILNMAQNIPPLYIAPAYQRDDYRGITQKISQEVRPEDAVILSAGGLREIIGYYYTGAAPLYPLPSEQDLATETQQIINDHPRIFGILYGIDEQDPEHILEKTLNNNAYQVVDVWWGYLRYIRYERPVELNTLQEANAAFGTHITLLEYGLSTTTLAPNDALQIRLSWQTDAPLTTRYKVSLQLLNADGVLVAQRDTEPNSGLAITTVWQPNVPVTDHHALLIPSATPSGDYTLIVRLYDANDANVRLPVNGEDGLVLATLTIE